MSSSDNTAHRPLSGLFTALSVLLFLGGFYLAGSLFFAARPWYIRFLVMAAGLLGATGALALTDHWNRLRELAVGARIEMRKVFWPGKDELVKTTLMVLAIVAVFALFLTLVDGLLAFIIAKVLL